MHPTRCYPLLFFRPHVLIFSNILEFPKPSKGRQSLQHQPKQTPGNKNHKLTAGRQSWGWQGNTSVYTCTQVCVCVCLYVSGGMCEGRLSRRRKWSQRKPIHRDLTISKLWDSRILCHQTVTHNEKSHTTSRVYELVSPLAFFFFFFAILKTEFDFQSKNSPFLPHHKNSYLKRENHRLACIPKEISHSSLTWLLLWMERYGSKTERQTQANTAPPLATEPALWSSKEKEPSPCIFCILEAPKLLGFSSSSFL